ncbi:unnamed protein product [Closterium sp. NIES-54]
MDGLSREGHESGPSQRPVTHDHVPMTTATSPSATTLPPPRIPFFQWDYRWMDYPGRGMRVAHPSDQSLMTYRNHHVLQTLIRCSPFRSLFLSFFLSFFLCLSASVSVSVSASASASVPVSASPPPFCSLPPPRIPFFQWDYRWMDYPGRGMRVAHPSDQSLMTYRNHHVLQTLIRCYFSPLHSTAQRFVYSGSHDGAVYIFDLVSGREWEESVMHCITLAWSSTLQPTTTCCRRSSAATSPLCTPRRSDLWIPARMTAQRISFTCSAQQAATRSQQPPSGRSCLLPAAACLLLAACCRLPAACLLPVCLLAASFRLPAACLLPACCLLPAACCLLPPTCCFLPLPPASYLVPTASCLLPAACYLLPLPPASSFEPDGRPIEFAVWLDDLQLFLLIDAKEGVSLFDYVSGTAVTPAADAPALERSQWQTRDAAARLAIRNHLPITERAHFSQHRTTKRLYDYVVARYSSPATAAIGRLMLPYLFPDLSSFTTAEDLVSHLCATDSRFRATLSAEDHFLALDPTTLTVDDFEKHLLAAEKNILAVGAARGTPRSPLFEGCSPSPLTPSYASAATAHDYLGAEGVRAAHCSFISHFM